MRFLLSLGSRTYRGRAVRSARLQQRRSSQRATSLPKSWSPVAKPVPLTCCATRSLAISTARWRRVAFFVEVGALQEVPPPQGSVIFLALLFASAEEIVFQVVHRVPACRRMRWQFNLAYLPLRGIPARSHCSVSRSRRSGAAILWRRADVGSHITLNTPARQKLSTSCPPFT